MKKTFFLFTFMFTLTSSFAAVIKSAKLSSNRENILLDVVYGGGCGQHDFSLQVVECFESMPVQCNVNLIHKSNDPCEALIYKTIKLSLKESGLTDPYYKEASLIISGDLDWENNTISTATIKLP